MAVYSIGDLEKLTGIKAHTIRIWEKRYNLLDPERTSTNIRYYTDKDLKQLMNVAILKKQGMRISQIAALSSTEINEQVKKSHADGTTGHPQLDALTISMMDLDQSQFNELMDQYTYSMGFEKCMFEVIYPLLNKLSLLWATGSIQPIQEKFMSQMIRHRIIAAINELPRPSAQVKFLLFLLEGENQELSLLFLQYILMVRNVPAVNIGINTPLSEVESACEIVKPDYLFTILNQSPPDMPIEAYLERLSNILPQGRICVTGYQLTISKFNKNQNMINLDSLQQAIDFIEAIQISKFNYQK